MGTKSTLRCGLHIFHIETRGACLLRSYEGPGGEVKVPEGVERIGEDAFALCSQVTGVILPEGVRWIQSRAFWRSGVRHISLPESLYEIGAYAFSETPLERVELPDQVGKLDERAFSGAAELRYAKLSAALNSLNPHLFQGCTALREVLLPEGLRYLQGGVFQDCTALEEISLPESLEVVWVRAFCGCSALRRIRLGERLRVLGWEAFRDCTALEEAWLPEQVQAERCDVFENDTRLTLTGPGATKGLVIAQDPMVYYLPGAEKVTVPEGVSKLPDHWVNKGENAQILDLPKSLRYYSWSTFARLPFLRQIVTDRDALAAEIALLLDVDCVDREGRPFVYHVPKRAGKWRTEWDEEYQGLRLTGCLGQIGHTGNARYTTVVLPEEIQGQPVVSIGEGAFEGYDSADAFYVPDSVRRIERRAFAQNGYSGGWNRLFLRLPKDVSVAASAFSGTQYRVRERPAPSARQEPSKPVCTESDALDRAFAERAADDAAIGTGAGGGEALLPNIWQYLDRLSREERVRELTHSFTLRSEIDGVGWASIKIQLDGEEARFRISYVGSSPADFRTFAEELEDGENGHFGWSAEPGYFPWSIQRRGGILYVSAPEIGTRFFLAREQLLEEAGELRASW